MCAQACVFIPILKAKHFPADLDPLKQEVYRVTPNSKELKTVLKTSLILFSFSFSNLESRTNILYLKKWTVIRQDRRGEQEKQMQKRFIWRPCWPDDTSCVCRVVVKVASGKCTDHFIIEKKLKNHLQQGQKQQAPAFKDIPSIIRIDGSPSCSNESVNWFWRVYRSGEADFQTSTFV